MKKTCYAFTLAAAAVLCVSTSVMAQTSDSSDLDGDVSAASSRAICYFKPGTVASIQEVEQAGRRLASRFGATPISFFHTGHSGVILNASYVSLSRMMLNDRLVAMCEPAALRGSDSAAAQFSRVQGANAGSTQDGSVAEGVFEHEVDLADYLSEEEMANVVSAALIERGDGTAYFQLEILRPAYCDVNPCYDDGTPMSRGIAPLRGGGSRTVEIRRTEFGR